MRTGSIPPSSPPWSAADSIGYAVWNRLTQYGVPPSGAGITVSGNTSAIHDRHMSFIGTLTAQPPGLASTAPSRRVDDVRVFRRAAVSAAAIVGQWWPISISDAAIADSTRIGIPPQAATVMRVHRRTVAHGRPRWRGSTDEPRGGRCMGSCAGGATRAVRVHDRRRIASDAPTKLPSAAAHDDRCDCSIDPKYDGARAIGTGIPAGCTCWHARRAFK